MVRYASLKDAKKAVLRWSGDPDSVIHIGNRGNSVFQFQNSNGRPQILRFTDFDFRTYDELLAELNFVNSVAEIGQEFCKFSEVEKFVARSLPTDDGVLAFKVELDASHQTCSSIEFASGIEVNDKLNMQNWNNDFFQAWGKNLALIHLCAIKLNKNQLFLQRWQWDREILIQMANSLIPVDDWKSKKELEDVLSLCRGVDKNSSNFGVIHADHAPQNFRYDPEMKKIQSFDFGNCCYHWFMSDVAISLSTVRRKENRDDIRNGILSGYNSVREISGNIDGLINLFIRLRVLYVYLSRLHLWDENPTDEQKIELEKLRELVHRKSGW